MQKLGLQEAPSKWLLWYFLLWPINIANVIFLKSAGGGDRSF